MEKGPKILVGALLAGTADTFLGNPVLRKITGTINQLTAAKRGVGNDLQKFNDTPIESLNSIAIPESPLKIADPSNSAEIAGYLQSDPLQPVVDAINTGVNAPVDVYNTASHTVSTSTHQLEQLAAGIMDKLDSPEAVIVSGSALLGLLVVGLIRSARAK